MIKRHVSAVCLCYQRTMYRVAMSFNYPFIMRDLRFPWR